jgi:replicative DNA helicase
MSQSPKPDWGAITRVFDDAQKVGENVADLGLRYFEETEARVRERGSEIHSGVTPMGIRDLDNVLAGGLHSEQMAIWMGGSGDGKSLALAHCAKRGVLERLNVVYYTLELSDKIVAKRFDSCLSRIPIMELDSSPDTVISKVQQWGRWYGNNLIIKQYAPRQASVNTLRAHLTMLTNSGFKPDLIVVDYLDLLKPLTSYNDAYTDLGYIATDIRALGVEFDAPVQTATQVNRAGLNADVIDLHHISDSLQKTFPADIVLAICRTDEEKRNSRARIFVAKNRNGPKSIEIPIRTAYSRMAFYAPAAAVDAPVEATVDESVLVRTVNESGS